jgi:thiaminase/transcriptional activator TenA
MAFSDELRLAAADLWEAQHAHPFVRGIGEGTLEHDRFRVYVRQDYLFLVDYARLLALACARAPRLEVMARFAELAHATLSVEMDLHRGFAAEWGISSGELERERPLPATRAYADFLLRTASLGDFAELVAALLPCMWGYSEIGERLARRERPPDERYARWIELYAGQEFTRLAAWAREICDQAAADAGPAAHERMREAFIASSRHELAFWDSAWRAGGTGQPGGGPAEGQPGEGQPAEGQPGARSGARAGSW